MAPFPQYSEHVSRSIGSFVARGRGPVSELSRYVRALTPGDRFIAAVLGFFVITTSIISLIALERSFMVEVPVHGGTLTEGVIGAPRFVHPLLALSDTDRDLTALTYAGLMGYDKDGNLVPTLAESYIRSEDLRSYTFVLRENAVFSDGNPVTAADVVYTVEKAKDPALKSTVLSNWANITVEALDTRTVRFTLPRAYAPFLEETTLGILPAHLWQNVKSEEFPFSPYSSEPVGAGPYKVANVGHDEQGRVVRYDVVANDKYVFGRPYLDRIRIVVFGDYAALLAGLRGGDVESAYGVAREDALRVPYSRVFGVFFNPAADPIYADPAVRRALSIAIDRPALVREVLGGYATPAIGPVPAGAGVAPLPLPDPATRVETARTMLSEGGWGWSDETGTWTKGGRTLVVALKTSNVPELKALAAKIQGDWSDIGVAASIELHQPTELTQAVIRPRTYGALLFGEVVGKQPDLYAFWSSNERADPGLNIAGYSNPRVDMLLERARTEPDPGAALAALGEANALIAADYPAAFTHTPDFLYTVPGELKGVEIARVASPTDRFATAPYWYRQTELVWPFFVRQ